MEPLFSAVITMYNKERWIARAVHSVLAQSEGRFELIVVDDGSTDRGAEVVRRFSDPRIRLVQQRNAGPSAARNAGIRAARGSYLAFLDADDEWLPWHLASALAGFASFPGAVLVGSGYKEIWPGDAAEAPLFGVSAPGELNCRKLESLVEVLSRGEFVFCTISAAIAREAVVANGILFDEAIGMGEDVNFFIRVSLAGETVVTGCVAAVYHRCDDESIMSRKSARARITPDFFRGVAPASLTGTTRAHARRFLFREYLKRAYQNRGIPLSRAEVTLSGCSLAPALSWRLGYLMVRYCPAPVMRTLVSLRKKL